MVATVGIMSEQMNYNWYETFNLYYKNTGITVSGSSYSYSTSLTYSDNLGTGATKSSLSYSLTVNMGGSVTNPRAFILFGAAGPVPTASMCSSAAYLECRPYAQGVNGVFYLVAQSTTTGSTFTISGTTTRPPTKEPAEFYIKPHMVNGAALAYSNNFFPSANNLIVFDSSATSDIDLYGSRLRSMRGIIIVEVPFGGRTLFGNGAFGTDRGVTKGSKATLSLGSLSSTGFDCHAYFTT